MISYTRGPQTPLGPPMSFYTSNIQDQLCRILGSNKGLLGRSLDILVMSPPNPSLWHFSHVGGIIGMGIGYDGIRDKYLRSSSYSDGGNFQRKTHFCWIKTAREKIALASSAHSVSLLDTPCSHMAFSRHWKLRKLRMRFDSNKKRPIYG
jgi:hypothetical protein